MITAGIVNRRVANDAPKAIFITLCILLFRDALTATISSGDADITATPRAPRAGGSPIII